MARADAPPSMSNAQKAEMHTIIVTCKAEKISELEAKEKDFLAKHPAGSLQYFIEDSNGTREVTRTEYLMAEVKDCALRRVAASLLFTDHATLTADKNSL